MSDSNNEIWISYCNHCDAVTFELNDKEGSDRCSCGGEFLPVYKKLLTGRPYKQTQIAPEQKWEYPPSYGGPNRKRIIRLRSMAALKRLNDIIEEVYQWRRHEERLLAPHMFGRRHPDRVARSNGDVGEAHRVWLKEVETELVRPLEIQRSHIKRIYEICKRLGVDLP